MFNLSNKTKDHSDEEFSHSSLTASDFEIMNSEKFNDILKTTNTNKSGTFEFLNGVEVDCQTGVPRLPLFDKNINYVDEYWNIYL